jgi:hypothetical protein
MKKFFLTAIALGLSVNNANARLEIDRDDLDLSIARINHNLANQRDTYHSPRTWEALKGAAPAIFTPRSTGNTIQRVENEWMDETLEGVSIFFTYWEEQAALRANDLILEDIHYLFAPPPPLPILIRLPLVNYMAAPQA